jgi:hypothetical protein
MSKRLAPYFEQSLSKKPKTTINDGSSTYLELPEFRSFITPAGLGLNSDVISNIAKLTLPFLHRSSNSTIWLHYILGIEAVYRRQLDNLFAFLNSRPGIRESYFRGLCPAPLPDLVPLYLLFKTAHRFSLPRIEDQ